MTSKRPRITDYLRQAIFTAPVTRYRISRETGICEATLSRFVNGKSGLDGATIDLLADYLDLELAPRQGKGR